MDNNKLLKYFAYLFAIGAFFDATTTMLGTADVLSGGQVQSGGFSQLGDKKLFIILTSLMFALLITIIVASSEFLLQELNNNVFKQFIVLPTVIAAFFYDFYTSILGVTSLLLEEGTDLFNQETNVIAIVIFLSLFMTLSPFIAIKLWSNER